MDHVRLNLLTGDPTRLEGMLDYIEQEGRPLIEDEVGSRGIAVDANTEIGVAIVESFWVSHDAMRESEHATGLILDKAAARATGTVSVEHFEVSSNHRLARPGPGGGVRLTRAEVDPKRLSEAIAAYEDTALPWLDQAEGLCRALLFVNRRTGHTINKTVWQSTGALAASRALAAAIRVDAVAATGAAIRALEEYRLVFNTSLLD